MAAFVVSVMLTGTIRVIISVAITVFIGWLIGLLLRRLSPLRYLARLVLVAPGVTVLYILIGVAIAITAFSAGHQTTVDRVLGSFDDWLRWPLYLLWLLTGLGFPARRRWRKRPLPVSMALG
ncbi:MAG TPA: hypothetical protein VMV93_00060 [Chloroflexota bacterium]|nr:hypothetical protein [Chloroflexota bacterium]